MDPQYQECDRMGQGGRDGGGGKGENRIIMKLLYLVAVEVLKTRRESSPLFDFPHLFCANGSELNRKNKPVDAN